MLQVGQRVQGAHGLGTIVRLNSQQTNRYLAERPLEAANLAGALGLTDAVVGAFYNGDRYPYIVRFDTGYEDVYSEGELEAV